jgi:hypothetical protein
VVLYCEGVCRSGCALQICYLHFSGTTAEAWRTVEGNRDGGGSGSGE